MIWNHIRTAFRILSKQKLSSVINIAGLGIGLAFFILLVAYVRDELTFDRFHERADRTYILINEFRDRFLGGAHHFIAEMLEAEFPEVNPGSTVRYAMHSQTVRCADRLVTRDFAFTDPGFFQMFSFDLIDGDPSQALSYPHQIVITAATAEALFSGSDPLGQTLAVRLDNAFKNFTVSAVISNIPGNSSLRFDGILHYSHVFDAYQIDKNNNDFVTLPMFTTIFLDLPDAELAASLREKLPAFNHRLYGPMWERVKMKPPQQGFDLLKFPDYHLSDVGVFAFVSRGRPIFSWILSGIAILVLILACFNSINLSLAQIPARLKEMGVRQVIGARRSQIVGQLLTESLLAGLGSLLLGLITASLMVASFNNLTGKRLAGEAVWHLPILVVIVVSTLVVALFTGLFPALTLSRCQAADVFRGRFPGGKKSRLSRGLIVFQFTVSLFFIIGFMVMIRQLHFMSAADLGYDPTNIILVHTQVPGERAVEGESLLEVFRNELHTDSRVLAVSADSGSVGNRYGSITRRYDQNGVEHTVEAFLIDQNYCRTLNIPVLKGRDFSMERPADARGGILVNEAFVKEFGLSDPVGKRFSDFAVDKFPPEYTFDPEIIGIVKDFHVFSLHLPIGPMAFGLKGFPPIQRYRNILIKARGGGEAAVCKKLESIWAKVRPDLPFSYTFLDDALAWEYRRERDWGRIVGWSAGFALFIACMGLFGLTAVSVARRTKETGVRRILGASVSDIVLLFTRDILKWVVVANLLSWPVVFIAARKWLDGFAYRIDMGLWMFVLAAILSFVIAGLIVSWHAVRAAFSNPVQSLRYE